MYKLLSIISIFFLISVSIAVNIGRAIEKKRWQESKNELLSTVDYFSEEQVNEFLTAYFTFKNYGDNYSTYESFLSTTAQSNEKKRMEQSKVFPQFFGNSTFVTSENYTRIVNKQQIEVICKATRKIDSLNQEGKTIIKNFSKVVTLKLSYAFDEENQQFLIENYVQLENIENIE